MHNHNNTNNASAKDFKGAIKKLISYNKPYMGYIITGLIAAFLASILSIIGPDKLKDITNIITSGIMTKIDMNAIRDIGLVLIAFYAGSLILNYVEGYLMAYVTSKLSRQMRNDLSVKINKMPLSYFDNTTVGDTLSRMTNDVDMISQTMNQSFSTLIAAIAMFIGSLFMMFKTSPILAVTSIASSLIGFAGTSIILKHSQKYFTKFQQELGNINGHIEEVYSGHNVVNVYNAKEEAESKFDKINEALYENGRKSQFYSGLMHPLMGFIGNLGYVAVCIVGAILAIDGQISFGVIVAFMIYVRLFTQPLSQFAQALSQLQSTAAASERVFEFLESPEENDESHLTKKLDKSKVKGNIVFKDVSFGYEKDHTIIKKFNANVKPGEKVAIVGPTGAGKTTIVNLLMKFYEIDSGDILIDGVSIHELTRENIHDLFVMVLQDTWLFEGTIEENIRYNNPDITLEEIKEACKVVGLDHFIKTLPNGYKTIIRDDDSLSQGQKQLLTIARSIVDDSPFLILDEATSSVDTRTEELVQKAMDKLTKNRTSFIIAHRLSTIKNADIILVVKDGNIIEQGNHKELIKQNGFYAELYNSQFKNTID